MVLHLWFSIRLWKMISETNWSVQYHDERRFSGIIPASPVAGCPNPSLDRASQRELHGLRLSQLSRISWLKNFGRS